MKKMRKLRQMGILVGVVLVAAGSAVAEVNTQGASPNGVASNRITVNGSGLTRLDAHSTGLRMGAIRVVGGRLVF